MLIFTLIISRIIILQLTNGITDTNISNNIEDIVTDSSALPGILDDFASGDLATKLGMQDFESRNIFQNSVQSWYDIITGAMVSEEDLYFDISLHGEAPYRLYASQISVPNNALRAFCTMFLIAGTIVFIYIDLHKFFLRIQSLDWGKAFNESIESLDIFKM